MPKTKRKTRTFREKMCANCGLADKREMRMNRPNFCSYTIETGKEPDIRNGHCTQIVPAKSKRGKKADENGDSTEG